MAIKINKINLFLIALLCTIFTLTMTIFTTRNTNLKSFAQDAVRENLQIVSIELNNDSYKNTKTFSDSGTKTYATLLDEEVVISCINTDDSEIILTCDKTSNLLYSVESSASNISHIFLRIDSTGEFKITLIQNNSYDYFTITIYEKIDNITIACNQNIPMEFDEIYFYLIFNNNKDLGLSGYTSHWKTTNKNNVILNFPAQSGDTALIFDAFNNHLILIDNNFNGNWSSFNIECEITLDTEKFKANLFFQLNKYTIASTFKTTSDNIVLLNNDNNAYVEVYITKNAKPLFSIFDSTNAVKLTNFNKIKSDNENLDKYSLSVLANTSTTHEILLLINSNNVETTSYLSLSVNTTVYEKIDTIEVVASKATYKPNEKVAVSAIINNGLKINTKISWIVDDVLYDNENYDFKFTKKKGGICSIRAQVGDIISEETLVEISFTKIEMYFWYALLLISIITAFVYKFYGKKELMKHNKKLGDAIQSLQQQFKQFETQPEKLFKKSNYTKIIPVREKAWSEFDSKQDNYLQNAYLQLKSASRLMKFNLSKGITDPAKIEKAYSQIMKHIDNALKNVQTYDNISKTKTN